MSERPAHLPAPVRADFILDLERCGLEPESTRRLYYKRFGYGETTIIDKVYADPERYDTYLDQTAIIRAFDGDDKVEERLTHYEYLEVQKLRRDAGLIK